MKPLKPETVRERTDDWRDGIQVDEKTRLVKNVALVGAESKNGYRYSEAALRQASTLYGGKPVFLDHGSAEQPHERSTRDLAGSIVVARFEGQRVRGDIQVLDTEAGRTFLALAGAAVPGVGMSHVVMARKSKDGKTVEAVDDVVSVDAVTFPATTSTFKESAPPTEEPEMTLETLRKEHGDLIAQAEKAAADKAVADLQTKLKAQESTADAAAQKQQQEAAIEKAKADAIKAEAKRQSDIRAVCEQAGLPKLAEQYCADPKFTLADVNAGLVEALCKKNKAPAGDAGGDAPPEGTAAGGDADAKFKKEYAQHRPHFVQMGISEKEYVRSRRVDEGLDVVKPGQGEPKK